MKFTPSRGGRHKAQPLDLFTIAPQSIEDDVFERFRACAFDLMAKGFGMSGPWVTTCEDWWRSRFHDMLYPGGHQAKTHEEWQYNHTAETNWKLIWNRFKKEVINVSHQHQAH